jgi:hypothetical protein
LFGHRRVASGTPPLSSPVLCVLSSPSDVHHPSEQSPLAVDANDILFRCQRKPLNQRCISPASFSILGPLPSAFSCPSLRSLDGVLVDTYPRQNIFFSHSAIWSFRLPPLIRSPITSGPRCQHLLPTSPDIQVHMYSPPLQRKAAEKAEKAPRKSKKDPKAPKRALSAYMFFSQDWRERIKAENPEAGFGKSFLNAFRPSLPVLS